MSNHSKDFAPSAARIAAANALIFAMDFLPFRLIARGIGATSKMRTSGHAKRRADRLTVAMEVPHESSSSKNQNHTEENSVRHRFFSSGPQRPRRSPSRSLAATERRCTACT